MIENLFVDKEIKAMLELFHNSKAETNSGLAYMLQQLRDSPEFTSGNMTVYSFVQWTRRYPAVVSPVWQLQNNLQKRLIGEKFWLRLTEERSQNPEKDVRGPSYIVKLRSIMRSTKEHHDMKRSVVQKKRQLEAIVQEDKAAHERSAIMLDKLKLVPAAGGEAPAGRGSFTSGTPTTPTREKPSGKHERKAKTMVVTATSDSADADAAPAPAKKSKSPKRS